MSKQKLCSSCWDKFTDTVDVIVTTDDVSCEVLCDLCLCRDCLEDLEDCTHEFLSRFLEDPEIEYEITVT